MLGAIEKYALYWHYISKVNNNNNVEIVLCGIVSSL